jgi:hypothetical protein
MKRLFLTQLCSQLLGSAADARLCRPHPQGRERRATCRSKRQQKYDLVSILTGRPPLSAMATTAVMAKALLSKTGIGNPQGPPLLGLSF